MFQRVLSQPVSRLLILAMVIIAVLPIGFITVSLNKTAWDNSKRELREKHQLLAENLTYPIQIYVNDHLASLKFIANAIKPFHDKQDSLLAVMDAAISNLDGFAALAYLNTSGDLLAYKIAADVSFDSTKISSHEFKTEACFLFVKTTEKQYISGVKASPFNSKPTIVMGIPIFNQQAELMGVLLGELRISLLEKLRKNIMFGKAGHSVILDQNGKVIAHPNPRWMEEMKDLSDWSIVQSMKAGKRGVGEFYSSFTKQDMVAGFASVAGIGWGVMVPQPKVEIFEQVNQFMMVNYMWGAFGLLMAIIMGVLIARWITRPINRLAKASGELLRNNLHGELDYPNKHEPRETQQLGYALKSLVRGLQFSRAEVGNLNANLEVKIDLATNDLKTANEKLEHAAQSDYLTSLANRRYFEMDLSENLSRRQSYSEYISLLLFDIDDFKQINDTYGHAAGDEVLTQVARTAEKFMRPGDFVARYAGDEFVSRMRCEQDVAILRANEICAAISKLNIVWQNVTLKVTVSIGVYSEIITNDLDMKSILRKVDSAMYDAKKSGRNCVRIFDQDIESIH